MLRHGLRNALIPVVTLIGIDFGTVIGAAVLTETVFSWPGLGSQIADSVDARDLPVLLGLTLVVVLAFAVINLLVDLSYAWFDPRIRLGAAERLSDHDLTTAAEAELAATTGSGDVTSPSRARSRRRGVAPVRATSWRSPALIMIVILVLAADLRPVDHQYSYSQTEPRRRACGPSLGALVRDRPPRPRRVHPRRLRRPGVAEDRLPGHGDLVAHRRRCSARSPASSAAPPTRCSCASPTSSWPSPTSSWPSPSPRVRAQRELDHPRARPHRLAGDRAHRARQLPQPEQLEYVEAATRPRASAGTRIMFRPHPAQRPAADHRVRHARRSAG